jgi:hypothetical protein
MTILKGDLANEDAAKVHITQDNSPAAHLKHLLNIGWSPESPLIRKYVYKNGLEKELEECQIQNV